MKISQLSSFWLLVWFRRTRHQSSVRGHWPERDQNETAIAFVVITTGSIRESRKYPWKVWKFLCTHCFLGSGGTATLSISPRKVRQINDPIQQMLNVLHKVIYITQMPPTLIHNPRRTIIEKFKRALFSPSTNSANLKAELKKLASGSPDLIDINIGNMEMGGDILVSHSQLPSNLLKSKALLCHFHLVSFWQSVR